MDSSDESFAWTSVSNDSNDNLNMAVEPLINSYEDGSESGADYKQKVREAIENHDVAEAEHINTKKKAKKRKGSDAPQDFEDFVYPEKKRIKLEPESDNEMKKKKKKSKKHDIDASVDDTQDSFDAESYLNMRVKQEQASFIEPQPVKSKKKKRRKSFIESSDVDTPSESKATLEMNGTTEHTDGNDIIEDKFSAEETVVEKRKKKKHKKSRENKLEYDGHDEVDNFSSSQMEKLEPLSQEYNSGDETMLQPNDFTCTNIVSSTIINSSVMDDMKQDHKSGRSVPHTLNSDEVSPSTRNIVDRIRFEDDENSSHLDLNTSEQSSKFKFFLKVNPHLKMFTPKTQKNSSITEDDEVWILKCPHEVDVKKLINTKLSLEGKCKIKVDGQTYDGALDEDVDRVPLLSYNHGQSYIKNLQVSGKVDYRKRIPKAHIPNNNNMVNNQTNFILLPETKCRHPLFGANYKKAIKIPALVAEKLEAAKSGTLIVNCESPKKKKHKKDKKKSLDVKIEEECKAEPKLEPVEAPKKKRKRKHSPEPESVPKKSKKIKHEPDSAEAWESEKAIEENLFNF